MISNQTDYAMLLLEYLAERKQRVAISQIVEEIGLPQRYLARIASKLVKKGFLDSKEGVNGGYTIARPLKQIKLYDILKIFEGDLEFVKCAHKKYHCRYENICKHSTYWKRRLKREFVDQISKLTLAEMVKRQKSNA